MGDWEIGRMGGWADGWEDHPFYSTTSSFYHFTHSPTHPLISSSHRGDLSSHPGTFLPQKPSNLEAEGD